MNNIAYNQNQKQPQQQGTTNQVAPKPSSQPKTNLKQPVKSSTTTTTTTTTSQKPSSPSQQPRAASSLENLNKLDIVSPKSSGVRNASISSTSSTPNPHSDYYQNCNIYTTSLNIYGNEEKSLGWKKRKKNSLSILNYFFLLD